MDAMEDLDFTVSISEATKSKMASQHRALLLSRFGPSDVIFLQGQKPQQRNSDVDVLMRQDSNFLYLTGVDDIEGCSLICTQGESILFVPDQAESYAVWHGTPQTLEELTATYGASQVLRQSALEAILKKAQKDRIFALLKSDLPESINFNQDNAKKLKAVLMDIRAVKTEQEIEIIRQACKVASHAHIELMRKARPGLYEYQLESLFASFTSWRGCRFLAYPSIVGAGGNSSILHYMANRKLIKDGELVLIDAGCELFCYASDITRTFPANGKFTPQQALIYNMVLQCQKKLISDIRPGLDFSVLGQSCLTYLATALIQEDFIRCPLAVALEKRLMGCFMPHGLGHLLGLDVHDCLCYPQTPLKVNMVITIEPGLYFNQALIQKYLKDEALAPLLNQAKLLEYIDFGGVRIEDDVLVTSTGSEILTSLVPKEIHDIEKLMGR